MEEIDMSCSRTVTVSGFLQELRRKMVKEVADVMEVRNGLLANALVYPIVRFSLRNDREGFSTKVLQFLFSPRQASQPTEIYSKEEPFTDGEDG